MQAAWDESLVITGEDIAQVEDIDDDLSRELAFYNQVGRMQSFPRSLGAQPPLFRNVGESFRVCSTLRRADRNHVSESTVVLDSLRTSVEYLFAVLQALDAAKIAVQRLERDGKKWQRPADYYAQMVKSDEHMARVKSQLMHEQTQIAEAQER